MSFLPLKFFVFSALHSRSSVTNFKHQGPLFMGETSGIPAFQHGGQNGVPVGILYARNPVPRLSGRSESNLLPAVLAFG
jgi:hypothetical protein